MEDNTEVRAQESAPTDMLSKERVNELIKDVKASTAQKTEQRVREELERKYMQDMEKMRAESMSNPNSYSINPEEIANQVKQSLMEDYHRRQEEMRIQEEKERLKSVADKYNSKMASGPKLLETNDFNEIMADFEPGKFLNTIHLAADLDNMPDVLAEIVNNPSKLQYIEGLAEKSPKLAMKELKKISDSVHNNIEAKANNIDAPPPLSKIKSSTVGAGSGKMTLKDFKNSSWLRG